MMPLSPEDPPEDPPAAPHPADAPEPCDAHRGCEEAQNALAAWTRFEYDLARTESRRASALDPAWLPLQLLMSFVPETDAGDPY